MIDYLLIPTYRRTDKQLTWRKLPKKWQEVTYLIVDKEDQEKLSDYQTMLCPVQGTSIGHVREWIAQNFVGKRYGVFDDDIYEFCYTRRFGQEEEYPLYNTKLWVEAYDDMFNIIDLQMDAGFHMGGLDVCWNPPIMDKDIKYCNRQAGVHFYDGAAYPFENLEWNDIPYAEDYNIILQYLTKGNRNFTSYRYRTRPTVTQTAGGCSISRTIEKHNDTMNKLKAKFPEFVNLREKETKLGEWGSTKKLAANIQWTKAYQSSKAYQDTQKPEHTLEGLF